MTIVSRDYLLGGFDQKTPSNSVWGFELTRIKKWLGFVGIINGRGTGN